ncbi:MAG: hypothetical protein R6X32_13430 [Chloroflexota bacterium]
MKIPPIFLTVTFICLSLLLAITRLGVVPESQAQPLTVTFIDQNGNPISGDVRVLCFDSATAVSPFADRTVAVSNGQPEALPDGCTHLAALRLRHSQPAGKHDGLAYQIYTTSWEPGESQPLLATGDIMLNDGWPLTLFHVVASLGWTPALHSTVTTAADIQAALRELSAVLYDWTEGQMAVGSISIHSGGERWDEADLRFAPANDKRPSAFVGGIVAEPLVYNGLEADIAYSPAATYYGRLWDGRDAFVEGSGRWTQPAGYRTIAHEWAHYALFLYDEYQSSDGLSGYCICPDLAATGCSSGVPDASAMAYHYQTAEFWHAATHPTVDPFCLETWQYHVHGLSDWETLAQWDAIQGLSFTFVPLQPPATQLTEGPALGLTGHLFGREAGHHLYLPAVVDGRTAVLPPDEPVVNLYLDTTSPLTSSQASQIYLLQGGPDQPTRILPQGRVTGDPAGTNLGQIRLLDVQPGDAVRAYVDWYEAGQRFTLSDNLNPLGDIFTQVNPWAYSLEHRFTVTDNRVDGLTLFLLDKNGLLDMPVAQLCSLDAAVGCHPDWQQPMQNVGGWWQAEFTPLPGHLELPRYLVVRIVDGSNPAVNKEIVQWLQVAGGVGPTHNDGMAPLLDDMVMVNTSQSLDNVEYCNIVSYMPAANWEAREASLPPDVGGLIGFPVDISITIHPDQCPDYVPGQPMPLPVSVFINLGYSQDEVDRLGLNEQTQLQILRFSPQFGWSTWQQIDLNSDLNWITTMTTDDGIYAIGWLP